MKIKDSNKTSTEDKFKKLATKNFWISVAVYIFFNTSILASFHNFITADKKSNSIWATILVVLVVLFMVMLFLMRLHGNDHWEKLMGEVREEATGTLAKVKKDVAYKIMMILSDAYFSIEQEGFYRIIALMVEDNPEYPLSFVGNKTKIYSFGFSKIFFAKSGDTIKMSEFYSSKIIEDSWLDIFSKIEKLDHDGKWKDMHDE